MRSRALIGEFQPLKRIGKTTEPVRSNYYPALLTEGQFYALQAAMDARTKKGGKRGKTQTNLFADLLFSAVDGSPLWIRNHRDGERYLVSKSQYQGKPGADSGRIAYKFVEDAILLAFSDLDESDLYPAEANQAADAILTLKGKIAGKKEAIDAL
jgi:hypothetical protein